MRLKKIMVTIHKWQRFCILVLSVFPIVLVSGEGDFIGYGGTDKFTPNTITYQFDEKIEHSIVVAVHLSYTGNKLSEMQANFASKFDHWSIDKKVSI